jgi:hypothetical protein
LQKKNYHKEERSGRSMEEGDNRFVDHFPGCLAWQKGLPTSEVNIKSVVALLQATRICVVLFIDMIPIFPFKHIWYQQV